MPKRTEDAKSLTEITVTSTKAPAAGRLVIPDRDVRGLVLRITKGGSRSWLIRYRVKGRPGQRGETLAPAGGKNEWTLAKARQRARAVITAAKVGVDLLDQEAREREERRIAAERARTVRQVVAEYVDKHCAKLRSHKLIKARFDNHVLPKIGDKAVGELRRADVVELLDDIEYTKKLHQQVNRVRAALIGALEYAVDRQWVDANVAAATKPRAVEHERTRNLTGDELRRLWRASSELPTHTRGFFRFLVLTGAA